MRVRHLIRSDIPILSKMYRDQGFDYELPDLTAMETVHVVVDENNLPVSACAAEKLIQLYLFMNPDLTPQTKMHIIRLLHISLTRELKAMGYNSVEAFLPSEIADRFGKRLSRSFGWVKNAWHSWTVNF